MDYRYCPVCAAALVEREIGGAMRRACPACQFVHWNNPVPVVAALVERDGFVVLVRNRGWPPKIFGLVTGFLERAETPEQAVRREVKEELDLDATSATLIGVYPFARKNEVILAYHVVASGEITLNEELAEYRLIAPRKLRPWDSGTGLAIRDWMSARGLTPDVVPTKPPQ